MSSLDGAVALVTGGAGAIGRAIAVGLARAGASVVIADQAEKEGVLAAEKVRGSGRRCEFYQVDVAQATHVQRCVAWAQSTIGPIDVLINCAGIQIPGAVVDITEDEFDRSMKVNVGGMFLFCQNVIPIMVNNGGGSIVNISSSVGIMPERGTAAYCASKAAIVGLSRQMALDYARSNVRVNCLAPGWIDTPFNEPIIATMGGLQELEALIRRTIPMGRQGTPEDVANAAVFLAGPSASLITGAVLSVDAGITAGIYA